MSVFTTIGMIIAAWAMLSLLGSERQREIINHRRRQARQAEDERKANIPGLKPVAHHSSPAPAAPAAQPPPTAKPAAPAKGAPPAKPAPAAKAPAAPPAKAPAKPPAPAAKKK
jgi:predicted lipid-binding transport protein (Tim44 family)